MGLPSSQQQILAVIESELRADASLASAFAAFTLVTRHEGMPAAEQLGAPLRQAGWRGPRRRKVATFLGRMTVCIVTTTAAIAIVLAVLFAAMPGGHQNSCGSAGAALRARFGASCVPVGRAGDSRLSPATPSKG